MPQIKSGGGHFESLSTSGRLDLSEIDLHINVKEPLAVQKCSEALCADSHSSTTVLIKTDISTRSSYLNKQGSCRSSILNDITKDIFLWATSKKISIVAAHLPGKLNVDADLLSRNFSHETKWMFDQNVFNKISRKLLKPEIDLMDSSSNTQLPNFFFLENG